VGQLLQLVGFVLVLGGVVALLSRPWLDADKEERLLLFMTFVTPAAAFLVSFFAILDRAARYAPVEETERSLPGVAGT
jgi:hypothetical protein